MSKSFKKVILEKNNELAKKKVKQGNPHSVAEHHTNFNEFIECLGLKEESLEICDVEGILGIPLFYNVNGDCVYLPKHQLGRFIRNKEVRVFYFSEGWWTHHATVTTFENILEAMLDSTHMGYQLEFDESDYNLAGSRIRVTAQPV